MSAPNTHTGYELSDARPRPLLLFALGLVFLVVLSLAITSWITATFERTDSERREVHPMRAFRSDPEGPLLQAVPASELEAQQKEERELLSSYGWVDKENGFARIPLERAMQILGERGIQTFDGEIPTAANE